MKSLIEEFNLSEIQVLQIVQEWYTNGMCEYIFEDEDGIDLEEHCEDAIQNLLNTKQNN